MKEKFDIIITGAGAAGLLLAYRISIDEVLKHKTILIIDSSSKNANDRTWCFWEEGDGFLEEIVDQSWQDVRFSGVDIDLKTSLSPYNYKMVKGLDFYQFAKSKINQNGKVTWLNDQVKNISQKSNHALVETMTKTFTTQQVFNSILFSDDYKNSKQYPLINQHFVGWFVKTEKPVFDPSIATFMDFKIPQKENTRFMYVMPTSKTEALLEYTLFSKDILEKSAYEQGILDYLAKLGVDKYTILDKEQGCIPMTCYPFWKGNSNNIHHIGTAGGWTKPSTGYTFMNSIKRTKIVVDQMKSGSRLVSQKKNQFWFYDLLLIDVLSRNNEWGSWIFSSMFKTSNIKSIFMFLDEESSFLRNMKTIWKMPKKIFITALLNRLLKRYP